MEENKYYTPAIEEFHVGFEYELFEDFDTLPLKSWHRQVYGINGKDQNDFGYVSNFKLERKLIRVKYLDKEDIEAEGFIVNKDIHQPILYSKGEVEQRTLYKKGDLFLTKWDSSMAVVILKDNEHLFQGFLQNKSEFRKILKMIGV
jgi:hypothetical protein